MITSDEKSPFARYREGYDDGYQGHKVLRPHDHNYMRGYQEGKEDDQLGSPSKFSRERS